MMGSNDAAKMLDLANKAYLRRDWSEAIHLLDEIISQAPETPSGVGARLLRAMAYEFGNSPCGVDLRAALDDYRALSEVADQIGSAGLLGEARTMSMINLQENVDSIRRACLKAVDVDGSVQAKMLLGYVALKVDENVAMARKYYWSAFIGGSSWGIIYWAETFRGQPGLYWAIKPISHVISRLRGGKDSRLSPYHV